MRFLVEDMTCGHCTAAIEKAIAEAGGTASASLPDKIVTVENLGAAAALKAMQDAGYTPEALD